MNLDDFQRRVAEWGDRTFPDSLPHTKFNHLVKEVNEELWDEIYMFNGEPRRPINRPALAEECADVLMLLLHICAEQGVSLAAAAEAKFAEVQTRRWGAPDAAGVVEHIREEEADR